MTLPTSIEPSDTTPTLRLTVIVPARNEAANIGECLESLVAQTELGFALGQQWELLVVDDGSTDTTRALAEAAVAGHEGVQVLEAPPLDTSGRGGFTGKNGACWFAAQQAKGAWLLFTDADTVHEMGDLSRSIHEAERHKAQLLSYSPRQILTGFWQHAVMPLIFSELSSVYPPKQVNDPENRIAAANGQFLLVEREAYFAVGGHRVVGQEILEDVALANRVKRAKYGIRLRYAPEAVAARMYRTLPEMVEGWTKNLALLMPSPLMLAAWRVLDVLLLIGLPVIALAWPFPQMWQRLAILVIWLRTVWRYYSRVARSNFPAADIVLSVAGLPLFAWMLVKSAMRHRVHKSVEWKGRSYKVGR